MEFPIIIKLGGRERVAELLNTKPNTVRMWTERGSIPGSKLMALWDEAVRRRMSVTSDDFKVASNGEAT